MHSKTHKLGNKNICFSKRFTSIWLVITLSNSLFDRTVLRLYFRVKVVERKCCEARAIESVTTLGGFCGVKSAFQGKPENRVSLLSIRSRFRKTRSAETTVPARGDRLRRITSGESDHSLLKAASNTGSLMVNNVYFNKKRLESLTRLIKAIPASKRVNVSFYSTSFITSV